MLCVDRPAAVIPAIAHPGTFLGRLRATGRVTRLGDNLYLHRPWMALHEQLALHLPGGALANRLLLRRQIAGALRQLRLARSRRIAWLFHPYQADLAGAAAEDLTVYECHDEYMADGYVTPRQQARMRASEARLLARADVVLTTSRRLYQTRRISGAPTYLTPNGVDFDLFAATSGDDGEPADLAGIPRPRIGYAGAISQKLDCALLDWLAEREPVWSFVLVGPMEWNALHQPSSAFARLTRRPNVHLLGVKPYRDVPALLRGCDVLVMPSVRRDAALAATYPLKLNEYLATGRPVVATPFSEDLEEFRGVVRLEHGREAFHAAIMDGLTRPDPERAARAQAVARANGWDRRAEEICAIIARHLAGPRPMEIARGG